MAAKKELTLEKLTIVSGKGEPRMFLTTDSENGMPVIYLGMPVK